MKTQSKSGFGAFQKAAESIYRHSSSGAYYARFRHKGERIMQRLGTEHSPCSSLPEAKRLLKVLKTALETTEVKARKKTLAQILKEFRANLGGAEKTRANKNRQLDRMEKEFPLPLSTLITEIKKTDLMRFMAQYDDGVMVDRYNAIMTVVRDVFAYAVDDKAIASSPALGMKYKKEKDSIKRLTPSFDQFLAIVESIRSQPLADTAKDSADLVEFMGLAGLGTAECDDLKWRDINFETNTISVIRMKTSTEFSIPIYPQLRPLLVRMNEERDKDKKPSDKVFKVRDPKKSLASACDRLGYPPYSPRAFRRLFITRCLELGIDPQTIAQWQGHRDGGQLILRVYGRVSQQHQHLMATRLASLQSKIKNEP